jgi:hypothetical protein
VKLSSFAAVHGRVRHVTVGRHLAGLGLRATISAGTV